MTADATTLRGVLTKTTDLIGAVRTEHLPLPTPCPDYDVASLVDHLVGWMRMFAARVTGEPFDEDASAYKVEGDAAKEFAEAAERAVAGFQSRGIDRPVQLLGSELPGQAVLGMMLGEYVGHGWDLATATSQPVPFSDAEAEAALDGMRGMLTPDFRGPDKSFGYEVQPPADATPIERLMAFLGRDPRATCEPVRQDVYEE